MKIGFDAKRLFYNKTGLGNYSRTLVANLQNRFPQNEFHLYTPSIKPEPYSNAFLDKSKFQIHLANGISKKLWRAHLINKDLDNDGIELYHGLSNELPFGLKIKSVVTIHDLIFKIYPNTYNLIDRFIYNYKFKNSCMKADKIIAISEHTKKDIVHHYHIEPNKIEVVYQTCNSCFIDGAESKMDHPANTKYLLPKEYLLYVGSVEPRKNLSTLINSYQYLPLEFQLPLVIIGKGKSYKLKIFNQIQQLNLKNKIIWIENLESNEQLASIYQQAAVFIYPSLYEGFGIPIIEALYSKTPVITSNCSSLPEAAGPDSFYFNPLNPVELSETIITALTDNTKRKIAIENGLKYAKLNFSEKIVSDKLMSIYKGLIL
ncbi:MAG: glycosyltransferase family 1 protein [Saprospiraceae bacterium]